MKALITGTPGWLGTGLAESLVKEGRRVRCLVQPGVAAVVLEKLGAEIVHGDITDRQSLRGICTGVATVFHCAGIIHPKKVRQFYQINTYGTLNLAEEAIRGGVERFIYVSSNCAGIGDSRPEIACEDATQHPFMHYGLSKLKAEQVLEGYCQAAKIKTIVIRPNWLYGIKGPDRQLQFLRMIRRGHPPYFGNGRLLHSLCDINNCIDALRLAEHAECAIGKKYYIADARSYSILEVYGIVAGLLGLKVSPRYWGSFPAGSIPYYLMNRLMQGIRFYRPEIHISWEWSKNLVCSIDKAKQDLGYAPRFDFQTGMALALDWCKKNNVDM